jgi:hypothetical protein
MLDMIKQFVAMGFVLKIDDLFSTTLPEEVHEHTESVNQA